jgi:phosphatidylserine/phosphatidylglycerophosphate/cardiolipin synthase-like enzyme
MTPRHIARVLELLAEERAAAQRTSDRVQLVCSPPDLDQVDARDTAVVVRDLLRDAKSSVLIVSFALDHGDKARALFGELASRMDADPTLTVQLFANIHRVKGDERADAALVSEFKIRFKTQVWPGARMPELFYDPRSLVQGGPTRAVLHAKCIVADKRWTLVTSANFTEAAHERNIEAGVLLDDPALAARVTRQFEGLASRGSLRRLLIS